MFLAKDINWRDFEYPYFYTYIFIILFAFLQSFQPAPAGMEVSFVVVFLFSLITTPIAFMLLTWIVQKFMNKRACDSSGRMFRLVIAVSVIDLLAIILFNLQVHFAFLIVVVAFSFWIAANALSQVCTTSFKYALTAVVVSYLIVLVTMLVTGFIFGFIGTMTGVIVMPQQ